MGQFIHGRWNNRKHFVYNRICEKYFVKISLRSIQGYKHLIVSSKTFSPL